MNTNISANEIDFNKHIIIDIRTQAEHEEAVLNEAVLYPIDFNNLDIDELKNYFVKINSDYDNIVLMCFSGARSRYLCDILNKENILVKNLVGGIAAVANLYPEKITEF